MPILGAMSHHVVLLRGINVGGRHSLAMAEVREALGGAGFTDVATYIQSGNIVLGSRLEASRVADRVQGVLEELAGFPVPTVVLGAPELAPYDRILVSAMASKIPADLLAQLGPAGIMVIPADGALWRVTPNGAPTRLGSYRFVPLVLD